ncbi:hypothetical protein, partial [Herbaspirillum sp.]|uniref:hypothetical protein n=1 Tax=Herbaspirillum sp. TaxID=1890675 RepID=UPI00258E3A2F
TKMSKIALALKINLSQIDMARAFQGKKGQYLDATIFVEMDELDQYGNSGMITQDVSKEEKQQGVKGNILGNGKVFWIENGQAPQQAGAQQQAQGGFQQQAPQQGFQQAAPQQGFQQQQQGQGFQQAPQQQQQQQQQQPNAQFCDDIQF